MDWSGWAADFRQRAYAAGDAARLRLTSLIHEAYGCREREPERALALYDEGRGLARRLNEPLWALCYDAWAVGQLVHYARDFRRALDRAVVGVLEARKPAYDGCPSRVQLQHDLLAVHFCVDPDGYADQIAEGFREIESRLPDDFSSRLHHLNLRRWCAEQSRRPGDHYAAAQRVLGLIASNPGHCASLHYSTFVCNGLCRVHFARGEWQELAEVAAAAGEASRKVDNQVELAVSLLWLAAAAFHRGDMAAGRGLRRRGVRAMERLGVPPPDAYFEALSFGHELAAEENAALEVRDRELDVLRRQGRTVSEVYCHRERCRLLAARGRLTAGDLAEARTAALRLRFPEAHLAELGRLAL